MTTPSNAEKNIRLARWRWPSLEWRITDDDRVYAPEPEKYFDLADQRDRTAVRLKLSLDHNITILERKRSGRTVWEAVTRDGGSTEHESLEILLWQVVDKILEGGK